MNESRSILIVEDDELLRNLYKELLKNEGFTVTTAKDGAEALEYAEMRHFNLILLDILLPKIDGIEVLKRLKARGNSIPQSPIILLTNLGQDSIIEEGRSLGAQGHLIKSDMTPDQVINKIKEFLSTYN